MINDDSMPGRIDLRSLDDAQSDQREERIVHGAMSRIRLATRDKSETVLESTVRYWRPALAAAAVFIAMAVSAAAVSRRDRVDSTLLAQWAESQHVPTNGELLTTFQGYQR